jgi:DNA helicase-2/ATP-dependent DNA helicase PcrA
MPPSLDKSQQQFCDAPPGHLRLLAPAGCGKTLSLLFRCVALAQKAKPQNARFLIVAFTVAAKQELASRLNEDDRFAAIRDHVEIATLNSWGFRRLRNIAFNPTLLTGKDKYHFAMLNQLQPIWMRHEHVKNAIELKKHAAPRQLMDLLDAFKSLGFDHVRQTSLEQFSTRLKEIRSQGLGPKIEEIINDLAKLGVLVSTINRSGEESVKAGERDLYNRFYRFWREATQHLIESATFTLEDQKYVAYLDERQKLEEGKYLTGAARYDHVLVDEFQDINPLDLALLKAVIERNRATITIVGDDDQALFEWRGATPEYILDPTRFLGFDFKTFTLATNYRSPANIVDLSQRLIAHNTRRVEKKVRSSGSDKATIDIRRTDALNAAMELVYSEVKQFVRRGQSPARVAIIGRKRSQIIPYQVFFASKEVSFCAAEDLQVFLSQTFDRLLRLILIKTRSNTRQMRTQVLDDLMELCNLVKRYPLSKADRESLRSHLSQTGASTLSAAVDALAAYRGPLKGANPQGRISTDMADSIRHFVQADTVSDSIEQLGAHFEGLQVDLGKAEDDIFFADPPFLHLAEYATRYGNDYVQFVEDIERAKDRLIYVPPFEDEGQPPSAAELWTRPVHLMTALRAKGKEFDTVILLDVNDGIWPNRNAQTPAEKEAERRVFYVAFTRARKRLLMLVSSHFGNRAAIPSPFISELGLSVDEGEQRQGEPNAEADRGRRPGFA